jgi:hypothetical protein
VEQANPVNTVDADAKDKSEKELTNLLSNGDVTITLSME